MDQTTEQYLPEMRIKMVEISTEIRFKCRFIIGFQTFKDKYYPPRYKTCVNAVLLLQSRYYLHKPRLSSLPQRATKVMFVVKILFLPALPSTSQLENIPTILSVGTLHTQNIIAMKMKIELVAIFTIISLPLGKNYYMMYTSLLKIYQQVGTYLFTNGAEGFVAL